MAEKEVIVSILSEKDAALALDLFNWFQTEDHVDKPTRPTDGHVISLLQREDFHVIVALNSDEIVGGLTAYELAGYKSDKSEMFLFEIGVAEQFQRQGVATGLINSLKSICVEKGIEEMFVDVFSDNIPAIGLYKKTGGSGRNVIEFNYDLRQPNED